MTAHSTDAARPTSHTNPPKRSWAPLVACCLGTFLLLLYTSIVTVAAPTIGTALGANFAAQQWVIDVYTLALAGLLLGAGAISDAVGSRRTYLVGIAGFTIATLVCGLAPSPAALIAARAAQGVAGAALFASILPLIGSTYTRADQKATAFATWGATAGAASAVGTVCGGVLTEYAGWRWLFLGTVPLCLLALLLAARSLPLPARTPRQRSGEPLHHANEPRIDWTGIVLISIAITAVATAVIVGGESGWGDSVSIGGWLIAGAAGTMFALVERTRTDPILPPALVTSPRFPGVLAAAFGYYFAAFGALPGIAAWLQTAHRAGPGLGTTQISWLLVIQLVTFIAVSGLASGPLQHRFSSWTLGGGTIAIGAGAAASTVCIALQGTPTWTGLLPFLIVSGIGAGVVSPVLPAIALASAPSRYAGAASGATNAGRQLGLALGVAVCGTFTRVPTGNHVAMALAVCAGVAVLAGILAALTQTRRDAGTPLHPAR